MTERDLLHKVKKTIREQMSMLGLRVGDMDDREAMGSLGPACSSTHPR